MRLLPADARAAVPWRNGGGITQDVATSPDGAGLDDFGWRISIARIARDDPFSAFPGIDRSQILLEGGPVTLAAPGWQARVDEVTPLRFDGGEPVEARVAAPATVLNVMTRRGAWRHRFGIGARAEPLVLVARRGVAILGLWLRPLDALMLGRDEAQSLLLAADLPLVAISIEQAQG